MSSSKRLKGVANRRNFLLGTGSLVALSAIPASWKLARRPPPAESAFAEYRGPMLTLADLKTCGPIDVCVIGSGPAGTTTALHLARAGVRTLLVEAGVNPSALGAHPGYASLGEGEVTGDLAYPLPASRLMMPGGTTGIWTGNTPRLLPIDFERNAYTPEGADWPVTYGQMEHYYCLAERTLGVRGDSHAPYAAPRSHALPFESDFGHDAALKRVLARAGVQGASTFRSYSLHGGPIRVARDLLPAFARQCAAVFATGVVARRFKVRADGTVTAVELQNLAGDRHELSARCFVLASGGIESARRLLLSRSDTFPEGLGNASGLVGRTFSDHPTLQFVARVPHVKQRSGELPQTMRIFQFYEPFKRRGLGSVYPAVTLRDTDPPGPHAELYINVDVELWPSNSNRVLLDEARRDPLGDPAVRVHLAASDQDRATFAAARALARDIALRAGARSIEELPMKWSYHHLGTVRMGANPRTSVVDADLKVHGTRNLYVVTSGNFVTPGVSNPTLFIVALAHRLGPHLLTALREGAFAPQEPLLVRRPSLPA